jgi:DNA-directed RNA polymerase subunit M/transcription elongation factor TFIIS
MWKKQSQMSFQIEVKPQRISSSNYNCPKCGYKYKSLRSYPSNLDAKIIQITECLNCNYSWRESWELPMWRSYRKGT